MNQQISAIVDKILTKGMAVMESERAQQIMASPQAQKAMDMGMAALTRLQAVQEAAKAGIAAKLGLATQKELDELRETIAKLEAEKCCCSGDACKADDAQGDKAE